MEFGEGAMENLVTPLSDPPKLNKQRIQNTLMSLDIPCFQKVLRFGAAGTASAMSYFVVTSILRLLTTLTLTLASISAYVLSLGTSYFFQSRFAFGVWSHLIATLAPICWRRSHMSSYSRGKFFVFRSWIFVQSLISLSVDMNQPHE